jgi:predicted NBD/HSP70 family sugar kinase
MRITSIQKVIYALKKGIYTKNGIVSETNLSWGSCSSIMNLLYQKEIVIKTNNKISVGKGRKTSEYHFNSQKNLLFGIEIREDEILCSIINWGEHEISRYTYPYQVEINHSNIAGMVSSAYFNSLIVAGIKPESIIGLSIALAGGVDVVTKTWLFAPRIKSINNYSFSQFFKILPSIQYTFIEHDIHAQASSVIRQRKWNDTNYIFLHIGSGISMSIFNNGLYLGDRGFAGEIGHIPYQSPCEKGELQSVESAISMKGILNFINRSYGLEINNINEVPDVLKKDDRLLDHVYNAVRYILIVAINILDPNTIIIGGPVLEVFYPKLKERIESDIRNDTWAGGPKNIKWYKHEEMYGAYGTILNASSRIINSVIEEKLI